jgi:hypothetical protein
VLRNSLYYFVALKVLTTFFQASIEMTFIFSLPRCVSLKLIRVLWAIKLYLLSFINSLITSLLFFFTHGLELLILRNLFPTLSTVLALLVRRFNRLKKDRDVESIDVLSIIVSSNYVLDIVVYLMYCYKRYRFYCWSYRSPGK